MRKWINLLEGAAEEEEQNPFTSLSNPKIYELPVGTKLYHGTNRVSSEWNPEIEDLFYASWLTTDFKKALEYASYKRGGDANEVMVYQYITVGSYSLLEIEGEAAHLYEQLIMDETTDFIAQMVLELYDGWIIHNEEVLIGDCKYIKFVSKHRIK